MGKTCSDSLKTAILLLAVAGLMSGLEFYLADRTDIADLVWIADVVPALVVDILRSLRASEVGRRHLRRTVDVDGACLRRDAHRGNPERPTGIGYRSQGNVKNCG